MEKLPIERENLIIGKRYYLDSCFDVHGEYAGIDNELPFFIKVEPEPYGGYTTRDSPFGVGIALSGRFYDV